MPTKVATQVEFYNEIRAHVGCHDRTLLNDTDLEIACRTALRRFNIDFPAENFGYLLTVSGQNEYPAPLPADGYDVIKVYWDAYAACNNDILNSFSVYDGYFVVGGGSLTGGVNIFNWPSKVSEFKARIAEFNWAFKGKGVYRGGSIWLYPAPSGSGDRVYFLYTLPRYDGTSLEAALKDIEVQDYEAIRILAQAHAHRMIGNKMRLSSGRVGATSWQSDNGAKDLKEADRLEEDYRDLVHQGLAPMIR